MCWHFYSQHTGNPANSRLVGGKTCPRIANPQTSRTMGEMCTLLNLPFFLYKKLKWVGKFGFHRIISLKLKWVGETSLYCIILHKSGSAKWLTLPTRVLLPWFYLHTTAAKWIDYKVEVNGRKMKIVLFTRFFKTTQNSCFHDFCKEPLDFGYYFAQLFMLLGMTFASRPCLELFGS